MSTARADAVFVIGCPRSGTSAVAWALAQHPQLWTSAESDFLWFLYGGGRLRDAWQKGTARGEHHWLVKNRVSFEEWAAALGAGVAALYRSRSGGRIWVEQSPSYTPMASELAALFPTAKFVHLVRSGEQVVHSLLESGFEIPMAKSVSAASKGWVMHVAAGRSFAAANPGRVIELRHERITADPEAACHDALAFLGVPHSQAPAAFLRDKTINSSFQKAADAGATRRWDERPSRSWSWWRRRSFSKIAGPLMRELGYTE